MAEQTKIAWCDSTFSPVIGCQRISPGCEHCFAEAQNKRFGHGNWGPRAHRRLTSDAYWRQPLSWERKAAQSGQAWRVFVGSLCDICEAHQDWIEVRWRLMELIDQTPHLIYLFLTKRPHNYLTFFPAPWWETHPNVWAGTTAENQRCYDERIDYLNAVPARVRFISAEPLLDWLQIDRAYPRFQFPHWLIVGCESGAQRRPMQQAWLRALVHEARYFGVSCFVKQMEVDGQVSHDPAQWPDWARVQEFPDQAQGGVPDPR